MIDVILEIQQKRLKFAHLLIERVTSFSAMVFVMDDNDNKVIAITGYADTSDANFEQSVRDAVAIGLLLELLDRGGLAPRHVEEIEAQSVRMIGIIKAASLTKKWKLQ